MSPHARLGLALACLLVAIACRQVEAPTDPTRLRPTETNPSPTTIAPAPNPTPSPLAVPPTLAAAAPITATLDAGAALTATRITLQLNPPDGWINLSSLFARPPWSQALHERAQYLADDKQTGIRLVEEERLGTGALIVALPAERILSAAANPDDPVASLEFLLAELTAQGDRLGPLQTILLGDLPTGVPGIFADAPRDPLGLFARQDDGAYFRLILAYPPESPTPYAFLLAAADDAWDSFEPAFAQALASAHWQREIVTLDERRLPRGLIAESETVTGQLVADQTDLWTLTGQAGQFVTLRLEPGSPEIDLTLTLSTPAGETLGRADFGLPGDPEVILDALLPETGTYAVEVAEFFGEPGRYVLSADLQEDPQFVAGGELAIGEVITGEMAEGTQPVWTFAGTAGQLISIVLTPHSEQLDLILELSGPDSQILISRDETFAGDSEVLVGFELPITGPYEVHVRSFADRGGSYALAVDEGGEDTANIFDAGDLAYGDVRRETLQADEVQAWFFEGLEADEVNVLVTPLADNLDLDIWLVDASVRRLAQKDEFLSGAPEMIELVLPAEGLYTILVREFFGEPGEYEIAISALGYDNLVEAGRLEADGTVEGVLEPGKGAVWHFEGGAGAEVDLTLTPGDASGDFVLVLRNPAEEEVERVDLNLAGEPEQLRAFRLPAAGEWSIVVREFFDEGGPYSLSFTLTP